MAGCRSTPEIEQEHLRAFDQELGSIYQSLHNEVLWLHLKWLEHRKLYAGSEERVELLNATAPFFFYVAQQVLWEDILMHVARLTDPAVDRRGRKNLSLFQLIEHIPDKALADEMCVLVNNAESKAKFARDWRNKRLAHLDLEHGLNQAAPLPAADQAKVAGVLEAFRLVMNRIRAVHALGSVLFDCASAGSGDADALACWLAEARKVEDERQQRARAGKSLPEDFVSAVVP